LKEEEKKSGRKIVSFQPKPFLLHKPDEEKYSESEGVNVDVRKSLRT